MKNLKFLISSPISISHCKKTGKYIKNYWISKQISVHLWNHIWNKIEAPNMKCTRYVQLIKRKITRK